MAHHALFAGGSSKQAQVPEQMVRRVVEQALLLVPAAQGAAVELVEGDLMTYVCCGGSLSRFVGLRLGMASSLSGEAVRSCQVLRCDNAFSDSRVDRDACERVGAVSMVCMPLFQAGSPIGVLKVASPLPGAFTDEDVAALTALAGFISAAVSSASELARAADEALQPKASGVAGQGRSAKASRFVANVLEPGLAEDLEALERTKAVLANGSFDMVYQPEVEVATGALAGAEALARFRAEPYRPPNVWFEEARRAGLGAELELAAAGKALEAACLVPPGCFLAVNLGPEALEHPASSEVLAGADPTSIVIELTEHVEVDDYPLLSRVLAVLRQRGARLAVDDTGAGFASFSHILKLSPDIIKLDTSIVSGIDTDPVRRSLATAVVTFARDTGAKVVAEGVEEAAELEALRLLGVDYAQGYLLGRPGPAQLLQGWQPELAYS